MSDFQSLVNKHFGYVCGEYGFARFADDDAPDSHSSFRRDDVEILVGRNRGEFTVEIAKGGPPTIRQTDSYFVFDLWCFAVDRDGDDHTYRYHCYNSDAELRGHLEEEIASAAKALRKYGIEVLEGRFDDWNGLRLRLKERSNRKNQSPTH